MSPVPTRAWRAGGRDVDTGLCLSARLPQPRYRVCETESYHITSTDIWTAVVLRIMSVALSLIRPSYNDNPECYRRVRVRRRRRS